MTQQQFNRRASICERYAAGVKVEAIAAEFGVSHTRVCQIARAEGLPARGARRGGAVA